MNIFITYGDESFSKTKERLIKQVKTLNFFDKIYSFDSHSVSDGVKNSRLFQETRGGGLWIWKPDIIYNVLMNSHENDIIVYCDAGCSVFKCKEWAKYSNLLKKYDIIAQKIYQKTYNWTRKELIDDFVKTNGKDWEYSFQFQATIVLKNTEFSRIFVKEWLDYMISQPDKILDVKPDERIKQHRSFRESRHDQSVYSAMLYKYLNNQKYNKFIYVMWEHIEDKDIFSPQAIRATRIRNGEPSSNNECRSVIKRIVKDYIYKPFFIVPTDFIFSIRKRIAN